MLVVKKSQLDDYYNSPELILLKTVQGISFFYLKPALVKENTIYWDRRNLNQNKMKVESLV
nr:MAG: hypothetical protein EDM05_18585 [Leptolyngbya sp. IPPAS B-1204]